MKKKVLTIFEQYADNEERLL